MSLNKLMLIGHVGKDPDIRILEAGSKVATFSFATTKKVIPLPMEHRFLKELNGIILLFGVVLPMLLRSMSIRETSCIWKER